MSRNTHTFTRTHVCSFLTAVFWNVFANARLFGRFPISRNLWNWCEPVSLVNDVKHSYAKWKKIEEKSFLAWRSFFLLHDFSCSHRENNHTETDITFVAMGKKYMSDSHESESASIGIDSELNAMWKVLIWFHLFEVLHMRYQMQLITLPRWIIILKRFVAVAVVVLCHLRQLCFVAKHFSSLSHAKRG